jgi:pimeloyl-ACP methyl ester carboxylesterase
LTAARALAALAAAVLLAAPAAAPAAADRCNPDREHSPKNRPLWWYRCADGDTVVVFVHGGASDNLEEWQNTEARGFAGGRLLQKAFWIGWPLTGPGDYWPWQVAADRRFDGASIAIAGYYTSFLTGLYGVDDAAEEWFQYLRTPHPATGRAVLDYPRILFVAHSAGGVIARYVLAKYPGAFADKSVGLLLAASGASGTKLLDEPPGSVVVVLLAHRLGRQLQTGSDLLGRVDACFSRVRDDRARGFELAAIEIAETKPYGADGCDDPGFLGLPYVVTPEQAIFHFRGPPSRPLDAIVDGRRICFDHETLVRPTAVRREPHDVLGAFYGSLAARALPGGGQVARWERLPPSTVTPEEQQQAMAAAAREAWARPLECR